MIDIAQQIANLSPAKRELLARRLRAQEGGAAPQAEPIPRRKEPDGPSPLSYGQERLWFLDQLMPSNSFYNMPSAVLLRGHLDSLALARTFSEILRRHEALRTRFLDRGHSPAQLVSPHSEPTLPLTDLSHLPHTARLDAARRLAAEEARRPFDLSSGPLLRASLLRLSDDEHVLLLTMHHIASDGWSVGLLVREVAALYEAYSAGKESPLAELPLQYADYAAWQREWLEGGGGRSQVEYWRERLAGLGPLRLPTDRPRPAVQSYRGGSVRVEVGAALAGGLRGLSRAEGVTLFMTLLGGLQALLSRYTGQGDVAVGTFIAGRTRGELEGLMGFFVNNLVLRTEVRGGESFRELLGRVRETCLGAYAHQEVPFEKVLEEVGVERDLSRTPLFQVVFNLQSYGRDQSAASPLGREGGPAEMSSLSMEPFEAGGAASAYDMTRGLSNFDLGLWMSEAGEGLVGDLTYNAELFERATVERMAAHYLRLLEAVVAGGADRRLADLPMLTEEERRRLLFEWSGDGMEYSGPSTLHGLFERRVETAPGLVAAVYGESHLSYEELDKRAGKLASLLKELKDDSQRTDSH